ncbi:MAG: protein translocase subunit SecF [candidate division KSB1 bacterium]|nr:protein translocase subunit SecF [candidate division KSB1 bacterium]
MMQFFKETHVDFLKLRRAGYLFSGTLILISLVSLLLHGGPKYGIDFTGGTSLELRFEKPISAGEIRSSLSQAGYGTAEIKHIGAADENQFIIRVEKSAEGTQIGQVVEQQLRSSFPDNPYEVLMVQEIGPKIGGELRRAAVMAILIALFGILVYISWRFEFKFAVGAVLALFHDVIITLGFFSVLNLEITLVVIAAFLTIVGYSLNDTIVVFDRIRENLKVLRRENLYNIINVSINQTLNRTINTSLTTLLVVIALWLFGGEVIHDFAFALLVGILIGTYSSIFIASPLVYEWEAKTEATKGKSAILRKA